MGEGGGGGISFPEAGASACIRKPDRGLKRGMGQLMGGNTRLRGESFALRMGIARLKAQAGGGQAWGKKNT